MSHSVLGATEILSCAVLGHHLGHGVLLNQDHEDENAEDSDYEDEPEPSGQLVSDGIQREEQRLFPVLRIGSSVA